MPTPPAAHACHEPPHGAASRSALAPAGAHDAHANPNDYVTYAGLTLKKAPTGEYAMSKLIGAGMWWVAAAPGGAAAAGAIAAAQPLEAARGRSQPAAPCCPACRFWIFYRFYHDWDHRVVSERLHLLPAAPGAHCSAGSRAHSTAHRPCR